MRRRVSITVSVVVLVSVLAAALPASNASLSSPFGGLSKAGAAVSKSLSGDGGGGAVNGAGSRLSDLLAGWAVPVLIVLAGCLLVGTLTSRNVGASVGIVLITVVGLIFLLSPQSIESLAKNVANVVF